MLSFMDTAMGLTIIDPNGGSPLRINKSAKAYGDVNEVLRSANNSSAQDAWAQIQAIMADPLKHLRDWFASFGVSLNYDENNIELEGLQLARASWVSFLEKVKASSGSPELAVNLAKKFAKSPGLSRFDPNSHCFHVHQKLSGEVAINLIQILNLPKEVRHGDLVDMTSRYPTYRPSGDLVNAVVSFSSMSLEESGSIKPIEGFVLQTFDIQDRNEIKDMLKQPFVLGLNRTYRCEEFTGSDWVEILSTDSLEEASKCYEEILNEGFKPRVINRISNKVVNLMS